MTGEEVFIVRPTLKRPPALRLVLLMTVLLDAQVVTDGLVLHYNFTGDNITGNSTPDKHGVIKDASGNGLDAVIRPTEPVPLPVTRTGWLGHHIRQGDGRGGWVSWPAKIQVLKAPGSDITMLFGIVQMNNGELALICSDEKVGQYTRPVLALSRDGGNTWTDFQIIEGAPGRPMNLTYHDGGILSLVAGRRHYSDDYGHSWTRSVEHPRRPLA